MVSNIKINLFYSTFFKEITHDKFYEDKFQNWKICTVICICRWIFEVITCLKMFSMNPSVVISVQNEFVQATPTLQNYSPRILHGGANFRKNREKEPNGIFTIFGLFDGFFWTTTWLFEDFFDWKMQFTVPILHARRRRGFDCQAEFAK